MRTGLSLWLTVIIYPFTFHFKLACEEMREDLMGVNQSFPKGNPTAIQPSPLATNHRSLAEVSIPREPVGAVGSAAGIAPDVCPARDVCPAMLSRFRLACGDLKILIQIKMSTYLWSMGNYDISILNNNRNKNTFCKCCLWGFIFTVNENFLTSYFCFFKIMLDINSGKHERAHEKVSWCNCLSCYL